LTVLGACVSRDGRTFYYLIWAVTLLALLAARQPSGLARSGRAIRALKAATVMAEASASTLRASRSWLLRLCSGPGLAVGLALCAFLLRFISTQPFGVNASIDYLFMAVIGGIDRGVGRGHMGAAGAGSTFLRGMDQGSPPEGDD